MSQHPNGTALPTAVPSISGATLPDGLGRLLAQAEGQRARALPPLEKWNPAYCGEMDLRITASGEWFHEGSKMTRQKLVDLFATVLWREQTETADGIQDRYFLKTPVEKIGIQVEDVPLLVIDVEQVESDGQVWIQCTTKTGDVVFADAEHPIFMRQFFSGQLLDGQEQGEWRPYIRVRRNLEALIHRNAFYHLLGWAVLDESGDVPVMHLRSGDQQFSLGGLA